MSNKGNNTPLVQGSRPSSKDAIEVTLPENLSSYLTPIMVLFGSVIVGASILFAGNRVAQAVEAKPTTTATTDTTTDNTAQQQQPTVELSSIQNLFTDGAIKFGDKNAKLLFVEVSDPSCPYCHIAGGDNPELSAQVGASFKYDTDGGSYVPPTREMKKLVDEGKASFVWVYSNGHGNGELATQAFYCAYEQGKFWEAHSLIMSNAGYDLLNNTVKNDVSKSSTLASFLKGVVNESAMSSCLSSGKYKSKVSSDQSLASSLGVSGTPGFFVNTTNFAGAYSFTDMQSVVDAALK